MPITRAPEGFLVDPTNDDEIPSIVGRLVINCGALEWETLGWVHDLATDPLLYDVAVHLKMAFRIDLVLALVERRQLAADLLVPVEAAWGRARRIAKIRNLVAHGPLAVGWQKHKPDTGPPDVIAVANLHALRHRSASKEEIVRRAGLERAVADAGRLVEELHKLRKLVIAQEPPPISL
jgi:hypothetical protein